VGSCFWPSMFLFSDSSSKAGARESVNAQLKVNKPHLCIDRIHRIYVLLGVG